MTTNQSAIEALENNDYEMALYLFKKALEESRDVQSLNNLAFLYVHEGIRDEHRSWEHGEPHAIELLKECISFKPKSHFPYNLLGEAYLNLNQWQDAFEILKKAIGIQSTPEALHNLAVAAYHLNDVEQAAFYYAQAFGVNEYTKYGYAKSLIDTKQLDKAIRIIEELVIEEEDYVGDIEIADLYVEMGQFRLAVQYFEKGWSIYTKDPFWVNRFVYALMQNGQTIRAEELMNQVITENQNQIQEIKNEPDDDLDPRDNIQSLLADIENFKTIIKRISDGYIPPIHMQTTVLSNCYWFGCKRHGHPQYRM